MDMEESSLESDMNISHRKSSSTIRRGRVRLNTAGPSKSSSQRQAGKHGGTTDNEQEKDHDVKKWARWRSEWRSPAGPAVAMVIMATHPVTPTETRSRLRKKGGGPNSSPAGTLKSSPPVEIKWNSPTINLKEYKGSTSIKTFFQQFCTCTMYYHWTEEDKGVYLRRHLTDDEVNLLWAQLNADAISGE